MRQRVMQLLSRVVWFALSSMLFLVLGIALTIWASDRMPLIFMCGAGAVTCAVLSLREER